MGGFQNWAEQVVDSRGHADYRRRVSDMETISMWQNLAIRCDRCMACLTQAYVPDSPCWFINKKGDEHDQE
jgi:hypothetical protein